MSSLKIDVSTLLNNVDKKLQWGYDNLFCVDEIDFEDKITVLLAITAIEKRIIVSGQLKVTFPSQCSRCLETYSHLVSEEIAEEFVPANIVPKEGKGLLLEELSIFPYEGEKIDLAEMLRQYIILSRPDRLLCKESCAGLCPQCGQNLNIKRCQCENNITDPRWAALKNFTQP